MGHNLNFNPDLVSSLFPQRSRTIAANRRVIQSKFRPRPITSPLRRARLRPSAIPNVISVAPPVVRNIPVKIPFLIPKTSIIPSTNKTMALVQKKSSFIQSLTKGISGGFSFGKTQVIPIIAILAVVFIIGFGVVKASTKKRRR